MRPAMSQFKIDETVLNIILFIVKQD